MRYNFKKSLFQEDVKCAAEDREGNILFTFEAHELAPKNNSAGYVQGGILSGSQYYSILTDEPRVCNLEPYINIINADGIKYTLTSVAKAKTHIVRGYFKKEKHEYILTLE